MTIHLVAVGQIKDPSIRESCADYAARIRHYMRLDIKEVKEGGRRDRDAAFARTLESQALYQAIPKGSRIVALTRSGRSETSPSFARMVESWRNQGSHVALLLGGAHGLDGDIVEQADASLSLSKLTLPHDLARLIILEQLYRACTILCGEPYHKESIQ